MLKLGYSTEILYCVLIKEQVSSNFNAHSYEIKAVGFSSSADTT
jgi:hypothetical protein